MILQPLKMKAVRSFETSRKNNFASQRKTPKGLNFGTIGLILKNLSSII